jgi:hypothetical protein
MILSGLSLYDNQIISAGVRLSFCFALVLKFDVTGVIEHYPLIGGTHLLFLRFDPKVMSPLFRWT